jgi:predicted nucleic acid-binding protein
MTSVLVDSSVLLDLFTENSEWFDWSTEMLSTIADTAELVINPVIFAEVSVHFARIEELDEAIPQTMFRREPIPFDAAFLAGKIFLAYRRRGGTRVAPLPDFFIGAHAAVAGYDLLTRNARHYRRDFPKLKLIAA